MSTSITYQTDQFKKIVRLEKTLHSLDEPYILFLSAFYETTKKNERVVPLKAISEHPSIKGKGYVMADIFRYLCYLVDEKILTHSSQKTDGKTVDAYGTSEETMTLIEKLLEERKTTKTTQVA
jgi:hypothetical protein